MLENIFQMIISSELQRSLLPLKIVILIFSFLTFVLIVYFLFKTSYLKHLFLNVLEDYSHWKHHYSPKAIRKAYRSSAQVADLSKESLVQTSVSSESDESENEELNFKDGRVERTDWERILDKLETGKELNYKLAFIDADKLFNQELKEHGKELSKKTISNVDDILKAKEVLEKMLANPKAELSLERAKEIITAYEKALSELS